MKEKILRALEREFANHRIVFWYDEKKEFPELFEELEIEDTEKITIDNNEFQVKYKILREKEKQKFLLYLPYAQPQDIDNWLLDVQLAEGVFKSDQTGLLLSEFDNNVYVQQAMVGRDFFLNSEKRRKNLLSLVESKDRKSEIEVKMLAVCVGTNPDVGAILSELIKEYASEKETKLNLVFKTNLEVVLWKLLENTYNYKPENPGIKDFLAELFDTCWRVNLQEKPNLHNTALAFFNNFKDNYKNREIFTKLSNEFAGFYKISEKLHKIDLKQLINLDIYHLIDIAHIDFLIKSSLQETLSYQDCEEVIKNRKTSFWWDDYKDLYTTIGFGVKFLDKLSTTDLTLTSMEDALIKYSSSWYEIDQLYRKFIFFLKATHHNSSLQALHERIEKLYTNNFLLDLNNAWQAKYDFQLKTEFHKQKDFFQLDLAEQVKQKKFAVIISDALRYEVGQELLSRIIGENRYEGKLEFMLGQIPSYTQLGMASLLPHSSLELDKDSLSNIRVDGKSSIGLDNRQKIIQAQIPKSKAYHYQDFMNLPGNEVKQTCVDNDLLYIYHNVIDAIGDKLVSEEGLPNAVEDAIKQLIGLTKKIAGTNRISNILITADHGFLYQNSQVDESDFVEVDALPEKCNKSRRFIIGHSLPNDKSLMKFTSAELNLGEGLEILIPKSINRFKVQGAGSRYVHGGASLQELVIPILKINKSKRVDDVKEVEIEVISQASKNITSGQISVTLYQSEAVSEKIKACYISVGLYSQDDILLSDKHEVSFDSESELSRDREVKVTLRLNEKAEKYNEQDILLKLKKKMSGTNKFVDYKSDNYFLNRKFYSDF
ncbi:BREX-1 system phosphatase PglZ type A [bacterium]|nr:BREX-1 system phosphatase PglZ type A [bacterium]